MKFIRLANWIRPTEIVFIQLKRSVYVQTFSEHISAQLERTTHLASAVMLLYINVCFEIHRHSYCTLSLCKRRKDTIKELARLPPRLKCMMPRNYAVKTKLRYT